MDSIWDVLVPVLADPTPPFSQVLNQAGDSR